MINTNNGNQRNNLLFTNKCPGNSNTTLFSKKAKTKLRTNGQSNERQVKVLKFRNRIRFIIMLLRRNVLYLTRRIIQRLNRTNKRPRNSQQTLNNKLPINKVNTNRRVLNRKVAIFNLSRKIRFGTNVLRSVTNLVLDTLKGIQGKSKLQSNQRPCLRLKALNRLNTNHKFRSHTYAFQLNKVNIALLRRHRSHHFRLNIRTVLKYKYNTFECNSRLFNKHVQPIRNGYCTGRSNSGHSWYRGRTGGSTLTLLNLNHDHALLNAQLSIYNVNTVNKQSLLRLTNCQVRYLHELLELSRDYNQRITLNVPTNLRIKRINRKIRHNHRQGTTIRVNRSVILRLKDDNVAILTVLNRNLNTS